jgi:hypothetical protein
MNRVLLQYVLPLLLPTLLYLLWWGTIGRRRTADAHGRVTLADGPWFWLILCGGLLLACSLVYTALVTGVATEVTGKGRYVPPQLKEGRVVPGHFERQPP